MDFLSIKQKYPVKEVRFQGTVGTEASALTLSNSTVAFQVNNTNVDDGKDLLISDDGGTTWYRIPANSERDFYTFESLSIKGAVADCEYDIQALVRQ